MAVTCPADCPGCWDCAPAAEPLRPAEPPRPVPPFGAAEWAYVVAYDRLCRAGDVRGAEEQRATWPVSLRDCPGCWDGQQNTGEIDDDDAPPRECPTCGGWTVIRDEEEEAA